MIRQQFVANVMEVANQRYIKTKAQQPVAYFRYSGSALVAVNGDANDFRASAIKRSNLRNSRVNVGRVGVGHRLHNNRRSATDDDAPHIDGNRGTAWLGIKISG